MNFEPRFESNRSPVLGTRGMVATSQTQATSVGLRVLDGGGNAADAAVAAAAALNLTEPNMTGIGGDAFALFYDAATRELTALNGSGRAPAELTLEHLAREGMQEEIPRFHAHSVTVPGACAAWCDLLERHGRIGIAACLEPAIELAERGFPVAPINSRLWAAGVEQLKSSPGGAALLIDGRAPAAGEIFRNLALAETFRRVAEGGAEAFYGGEIAAAIAKVVQDHGGVLSEADLAEHESSWEEPISTEYRGLRLWECPPNGQGLAALLALNILRGHDLGAQDPLGADRYHLMIEAMRLAFEDTRWYAADPRHETTPHIPIAELLSESYAAERRKAIDPRRANLEAKRGSPVAGTDTTYLCVVDAEGSACSFIVSNYQGFGTGLSPLGFGFTLQNRGQGFSLDPAHPSALAPRKRPYHTIIPAMLTREQDGSLYGPMGVMGGFMQPQGHLQVVVAMVDDDLDPQSALDRARFGLLSGTAAGVVELEDSLPEATRDELARRGHDTRVVGGLGRVALGRGQIIRRDPNGTLWGGSDPRADGCAMAL
jgi:gamma-glutamyltranspeptidase/glutathione hydrolase